MQGGVTVTVGDGQHQAGGGVDRCTQRRAADRQFEIGADRTGNHDTIAECRRSSRTRSERDLETDESGIGDDGRSQPAVAVAVRQRMIRVGKAISADPGDDIGERRGGDAAEVDLLVGLTVGLGQPDPQQAVGTHDGHLEAADLGVQGAVLDHGVGARGLDEGDEG